MARGIAHEPETRAAVLAALLEGQSINSIAEKYELSKSTVIAWRDKAGMTEHSVEPQKRKELGDKVIDLIYTNLDVLADQVRFFCNTDWLKQQNAADIAVLHGVLADKTFRLLGALRPEAEPNTEEADAL